MHRDVLNKHKCSNGVTTVYLSHILITYISKMAFSFRAGTNWYHDFPKLAKESGFYFNMHRTRVRVDWNRICSIDIDQVIQENDFQTVDDNVHNVIDYSLENEYDVKILDPNFVKLFRIAQLAVEYLLYCKQYLDQSVIILKDELKLKVEENVKLKKEIMSLHETLKDVKERNRIMDTRLTDPHGEVHKCPYCPKSFISSMFVNAHITRRHSSSPSPAPEEYRSETEKLHNEIKTLKERLNQTEKVINESHKWNNSSGIVEKVDKGENTDTFNLKSTDVECKQQSIHTEDSTMLINEMKLRMESEIESVQTKLSTQENYWRTKLEDLECHHQQDINNLFSQLKQTQESASRIKFEYETKIKDLEKQALNQSEMIIAQSEQLNNLTKGIRDSQVVPCETNKGSSQNVNGHISALEHEDKTEANQSEDSSESTSMDTTDSISSVSVKLVNSSHRKDQYSGKVSKKLEHDFKKEKSANDHQTDERGLKTDVIRKSMSKKTGIEIDNRKYQHINEHSSERNRTQLKMDSRTKETYGNEQTSATESEESEFSCETRTESEISESFTETTTDDHERKKNALKKKSRRRENREDLDDLKEDLQEVFYKKMHNLGIDPEWDGIPKATFNHKANILRHHQSINAKKFPKYNQFRDKLLVEVSRRLSSKQRESVKPVSGKKTLLNKVMGNVKMKAMKAFNIHRSTGAIQKQIILPRRTELKQKSRSDILPRKMSLNNFISSNSPEIIEKSNTSRTPKETIESTAILKQSSCETIDDFKKASRSLDMISTKVTSTPKKNVQNILQQSYTDESDDQSENLKTIHNFMVSPKNNKSVLKDTISSISTSVRKRVEFNLGKKKSPHQELTRAKSVGEVFVHKANNNDLSYSDWDVSSISDEKHSTVHLKNEKQRISEMSQKVPEQTNVMHQKMNVVETISTPSPLHKNNEFLTNVSSIKSLSIGPNSRNHNVPKAAPRNLKKSNAIEKLVPEAKDVELEEDINEIFNSE